MYVYIRSEPALWTVGFYQPNGHWEPESDHPSPEAAAKRVAYLNGSIAADALTIIRRRCDGAWPGYTKGAALYEIGEIARDALRGVEQE